MGRNADADAGVLDEDPRRRAAVRWVARRLERIPPGWSRRSGISVEWIDRWDRSASELVAEFTGDQELVGELMHRGSRTRKRIAVLRTCGDVVAVVPLADRGRHWEPLLQGVVPEAPLGFGELSVTRALDALGLSAQIVDATDEPEPVGRLRRTESFPHFELGLARPPDEFWRRARRMDSIRAARRRTERFTVVTDDLESAKWVIRSWRQRFVRDHPDGVTGRWADRIVAAEVGLRRGSVKTWALLDGDRAVAGLVGVLAGERLLLGTIHRDLDYGWHAVGTRIFDIAMTWAHEEGLASASIGTVHAYKRWLAPEAGIRWTYVVAPFHVHAWQGGCERIAAALRTRARAVEPSGSARRSGDGTEP